MLSSLQANQLIKARDNYMNVTYRNDAECTIGHLLDIITALETFHNAFKKPESHAYMAVIRGFYKDAPEKIMHALQFTIITSNTNDEKILDEIKRRFDSSVLRGFDIEDFETFLINEKIFLCGTGLGV